MTKNGKLESEDKDPVFEKLSDGEERKFVDALPKVYGAFPELFADLLEEGESFDDDTKPTDQTILERINERCEENESESD